jgi:spore coat protein U-like protein
MSTTSTWIKRTMTTAAIATTTLVAAGHNADAATATGTFQVQAQVFAACTIGVADLVFADYTSGQTPTDDATTAVTISCPGASAGAPVAAQFVLTVGGGTFQMTSGANTLPYSLFKDAAHTTAFTSGGTTNVSVTTTSQPVSVYGRIAGGLTPPTGAYAQTVTATVTY